MSNPGQTNDSKIVWIAGAVVVAILAVVAVVAVRSSDGGTEEITVEQVGPVAIGDVTTTEPPVDTTDATDDSETGDDTTTSTTQPAIDPAIESLPPYDAEGPDGAIGMPIPRLSGQNLMTGEPMTIEADGTAKVIIFVAHWCPACQNEVPRIVEHLQDSPMPDDVELVAVSTSVRDDGPNYPPGRWLDREDWTAPTLADSEVGLAAAYYGLTSFPYFVVADAEGNVVTRVAGQISTGDFDTLVSMARQGS